MTSQPDPPPTDPPDLAELEFFTPLELKHLRRIIREQDCLYATGDRNALWSARGNWGAEDADWICEILEALPWLLAQAREAERLRVEVEQLEARTGTQETKLSEAIGGGADFEDMCREVLAQCRKLAALEAEVERLRAELVTAQAELANRPSGVVVAELGYVTRAYIDAVFERARKLTALESALAPLVGSEVTPGRVAEAVRKALNAAGERDHLIAGESPKQLLARLYAVGRTFAYGFGGLELAADVIFDACKAIEKVIAEWEALSDQVRKRKEQGK